MQTLLIADSNDAFRQQLADAFQPYYRTLTCGNGQEALDLLCQENCDCLVLDLMLPELDGISMLETAVSRGVRPIVIAISPLFTQYTFDVAESLGIGYMIRRPCPVQAVVTRMLDLEQRVNPAWASREQINRFLLWLGVSTVYNGYLPLVEALMLLAENPSQSITKVLYPEVAKRIGSGSKAVERNIRSAIEHAWNSGNAERWQKIFPELNERPSNSLFFSRVLETLSGSHWE
ncbi:MAG: sporulation initiation factor Spo0A C-terminal domain-containing protein [Candidatus Faecousia sp.]|nr:response regulator [Clostridiales bacterium]MCI6936655.1 response regulator [Clostridiales bacterium]MDD5883172.1 sporulation initiation factor Spo0A C-terminal domain-containing protein [Bacillota bacterium]MDY4599454.1 sporulation initiation factor Spo0A C-terminal domain-containing protein [Candidatus Faecousia sp.]